MVRARAIALALALLGGGGVARAELELGVRYDELPNLIYELDCVAGVVAHCGRSAFEPTWTKRYLQTDDDRAALERWAQVEKKYDEQVEIDQRSPPPHASFSLLQRIRIAGLLARSVDDYAERIRLLVMPEDQAGLIGVVRRFRPRFHAFFEAEAASHGQRFADDLRKLLKRADLVELIDRFRVFYRSSLPADTAVPFVLIYRPASESKESFGEQLAGVSVLEFDDTDKAADRIDVAVHELYHFFSATTPADIVARRAARFAHVKSAHPIAASKLYEEGVATALGNGIVARLVGDSGYRERLATPLGLYANPDIDRAGKALLPWLDGVIASRGAFDDEGAIERYVELLEGAFGASLSAPRIALRVSWIFEDERLGQRVFEKLSELVSVNRLSALSGAIDADDLGTALEQGIGTAVIVLSPTSLPGLLHLDVLDAAEGRRLRRAKLPAIQSGTWRNEKLYVVVADDEVGARKALEKLTAADTWPDGIVTVR